MNFKIFSVCLTLTTCIFSHVMASQESEAQNSSVILRLNKNIPPFQLEIKKKFLEDKRVDGVIPTEKENVAPQEKIDISFPTVLQQSYKTLVINHPIEEGELGQLLDKDYREINLHSVYVGYEKRGVFLKKTSLTISPEIINPDVEVLSLKCCGLTDNLIQRIGEFITLKELILFSNHLTDNSVISAISILKNLKSLSLINEEISNDCVPTLLSMPSLTELDISHNKKIDDIVAEMLFNNTTLKKLNVRFTGLTRQQQKRLESKYNQSS